MEFTAKSVTKELTISSGKLLGGKVRNLITGAEYSLDIKDEFTVCYSSGASLLSARFSVGCLRKWCVSASGKVWSAGSWQPLTPPM